MPMRRLSLPFDILMIVFMLSAVVGLLVAYDRSLSYTILAAVMLSGGIYFAMAHLVGSWHRARRVAWVLFAAGSLHTLLFILLYGHQNYIETPAFILRLGEITTALPDLPIFIHPNAAAAVIVGLLPLGLTLAITSRSDGGRALWWMGVAVMVYGLLLSFSRGAFVALGMAGLAALLLLILPRRAALIVALALVAGVVALAVFAPPVVGSTFDWLLSRYELYRNSLYVARDYAFTGAGLGDVFALVYARYGLLIQVPFLYHAHNLPLAVWLGQGLPGLVALAALVVTFVLLVSKVLRCARPRRIFHGLWLGVAATLIHGLFDAQQYSDEALFVMPLLFALIGLTMATGRLALHKAAWDTAHVDPQYMPRLLPLGAALVIVVLALGFNGTLTAVWAANLGALAETRGTLAPGLHIEQREALYSEAEAHYQEARAHDPMWASASRRLGNLHASLGDYAAAVPLLEAAATTEPDNPAALKGLGLAYVWAGRPQDAAAVFNQLAAPEEMVNELSTWGFYRRDHDQPLLAAYAWDAMLSMTPDRFNADLYLLVADTYRAGGDLDSARRWYTRLLDAQPDHSLALQALTEIGQG